MAMDSQQRLLSLDAMRGFDMFWIMGGEAIFIALAKVTDNSVLDWWGQQMHHVAWAGFRAYDLIFPMFVFISGVAIPFALTRKLEQGTPRSRLVIKVLMRAVILVTFGLVYNGLLDLDFANLRAASVLGQIGLAYMIAALITLFFPNHPVTDRGSCAFCPGSRFSNCSCQFQVTAQAYSHRKAVSMATSTGCSCLGVCIAGSSIRKACCVLSQLQPCASWGHSRAPCSVTTNSKPFQSWPFFQGAAWH